MQRMSVDIENVAEAVIKSTEVDEQLKVLAAKYGPPVGYAGWINKRSRGSNWGVGANWRRRYVGGEESSSVSIFFLHLYLLFFIHSFSLLPSTSSHFHLSSPLSPKNILSNRFLPPIRYAVLRDGFVVYYEKFDLELDSPLEEKGYSHLSLFLISLSSISHLSSPSLPLPLSSFLS